MTILNTYRSLMPTTVGFDKILSTLNEVEELINTKPKQTYPPYNIYRIDKTTVIDIAVAGFKKDEIKVTLEDNWIFVIGETDDDVKVQNYIHRGLANRDFLHKFKISDLVEVEDVVLNDGILKITLKDLSPPENKTKTFEIK